jgi:adenylate cyclase
MSATGSGSDLAGKAAGGPRLIAVVYADMVGYSRLIGLDDAGTLRRLRTLRRALIDPAIREHGGNVVQTGGDSLLVAFDSIDGAVRCAIKVQQQVPVYDGDQPPDRRIRFRIGINIGDVIPHATDLHGDGVNVAARLRAECPVGRICISRAVRDHARDRLDLAFEAIGSLMLKNIARPVEAFVLRLDPAAQVDVTEAEAGPRVHSRTTLFAGLAGLLLVGAVGGAGWWMLRDRTSPPVASAIAPLSPRPAAYSPPDRRQSVIVLPFENTSGGPAQDSVAAGVTRDVMDKIAEDNTVPLVPAAAAAAYRGKTLDLRSIGRDHDVHFALTGNARRQDGRLIVAATLYQIYDDRPVWSKQFDRPDRPYEWSRIINEIDNGFDLATMDAEAARAMREHPNDLDKRDLMFAASGTSLTSNTKESYRAAIALMDRALALDPNYLWALQMDLRMHANLVSQGFSSHRDEDVAYAMKLSDRALQLAPNDVNTLAQKSAVLLRTQGNLDEAEALVRKVIELRPLWGFRYNDLGTIPMIKGHHKEALENYMKAKQLATVDDSVNVIDSNLAFALLANDRFPEAIAQAHLAIPEFSAAQGMVAEFPWLELIAAESSNGQDAEAHADLQTFLATPRTWRTMGAIQKRPSFAANPKLLDGLRRAGVPEQ